MYSFQNDIFELIKIRGPMPIDQFMKMAVQYYYANNQSIGIKGDFVTSPQISQMFGEVISAWCIDKFLNNIQDNFYLVELGPGTGQMMQDILRIALQFKEFNNSLKGLILLENSPLLREQQHANLKLYVEKIKWIEDISDLPASNLIIVANEFFDALPIKQFYKQDGKFYEIFIGLDNDNLIYTLNSSPIILKNDCPEKGVLENCPTAVKVLNSIFKTTNNHKLSCLIIDYGYTKPIYENTIQTVKNHHYSSLLQDIGTSDITAYVDFLAIGNLFIKNNMLVNISTQRDFLKAYGIDQRAKKLIESGANPANIKIDLDRLINKEQMGTLFKVLETNK